MTGEAFRGLRLSSEEVAELTERLFGWREPGRCEPGVPVESCLSLFEDENIPEEAIRAAVAAVVERRERRLSSVLERKAGELERMLLGLLARLDESFHFEIEPPSATPGKPGRPAEPPVVLQIRSGKGELEVRALEVTAEGVRQLFTILVQGPRPAGPVERLLGRRSPHPPRVAVIDPSGMSLHDLLSTSLSRGAGASHAGRAVAVAFERLHDGVRAELDGALAFVRRLRFEPDGEVPSGSPDATSPPIPSGTSAGRSRSRE